MCGTDKTRNFTWKKVYSKYEKFISKMEYRRQPLNTTQKSQKETENSPHAKD